MAFFIISALFLATTDLLAVTSLEYLKLRSVTDHLIQPALTLQL